MNSQVPSVQNPRGRTQLLLLAALFFLPLALSYSLYFLFPELRPTDTTNYGQLVTPAKPVTGLTLVDAKGEKRDDSVIKRRWSYVTTTGSHCDQACVRRLILTRQLRLSLNEKRSRVQRVLILSDAARLAEVAAELSGEHPDLHVLAETDAAAVRLTDLLEPRGAAAYLIDPLGNWLMVYPDNEDPQKDFKGMKKDIKKLLRVSQIG